MVYTAIERTHLSISTWKSALKHLTFKGHFFFYHHCCKFLNGVKQHFPQWNSSVLYGNLNVLLISLSFLNAQIFLWSMHSDFCKDNPLKTMKPTEPMKNCFSLLHVSKMHTRFDFKSAIFQFHMHLDFSRQQSYILMISIGIWKAVNLVLLS